MLANPAHTCMGPQVGLAKARAKIRAHRVNSDTGHTTTTSTGGFCSCTPGKRNASYVSSTRSCRQDKRMLHVSPLSLRVVCDCFAVRLFAKTTYHKKTTRYVGRVNISAGTDRTSSSTQCFRSPRCSGQYAVRNCFARKLVRKRLVAS